MPLLRLLGVHDATSAERRATAWTAAMFFCVMASTGWLRPLRDQFGVAKGPEAQPYLYSLTLLGTVLLLPPFWWLASRQPSRSFVPAMLHLFAAAMGLLALGLLAVGDYDWNGTRWVGETFWGGFNAFNVAAPTLVWIHAVEQFRRDQAVRLFGLLSVGGTAGVLAGSGLASLQVLLHEQWKWLLPAWSAVGALLLLEAAFVCHRRALRAAAAMPAAGGGAAAVAPGGMLAGIGLLLRSPRLCGIAGYMVLYGAVATAFFFAQTRLLGKNSSGQDQHWFLANQEACSQGLVLALQLFCVGHLLRRLPGWVFLCSLPALSCLGVAAVARWPAAMTVATVMVLRRGASFAFEKPAREVLYTPFDLATKHKVKFLLDTFMFRLGDLVGAVIQLAMMRAQWTASAVAGATVALAVVWIALGLALGRRRAAAAVQASA